MCGEVQWSSLGRNKPAVVGYNSEGNFFENHPLSGLTGVGNAVSCIFDIGRRRKRQNDQPNNMPMVLPADRLVQGVVKQCMEAAATDEFAYYSSGKTPETLANELDPCPCTLQQAFEDHARFIRINEPDNCYISSTPLGSKLPSFGLISLTQMCCYING